MHNSKPIQIFVEGPIPASLIADCIAGHQKKTNIGAHSIFLGQIRADQIEEKQVIAIEYTSYTEMAATKMQEIRDEIITKYQLSCMHVFHSLGKIATGEICLFVFTSSPHRKSAIESCQETVERIKNELPIWGKTFLTDQTHQWKEK